MLKVTKTIRLAITISFCAITLFGASSSAAPQAASGAVNEQVIMAGIGLLEDRLFSRQYANDPTDKRVERLELLVFGSTQPGSIDQRWARIKQAIASRAESSAKSSSKTDAQGKSNTPADTAAKYPVLNTLEWRALKKTFASETLDQRLARVEKKLFGQESPGMPYVDRVDRLKRTLGVGVTAAAPVGPLGPAPRARPRGQGFGGFDSGMGFNSPFFTQADPIEGDSGSMNEFALPFQSSPLNSAFNQMFSELNRQMSQLDTLNLGPGTWSFDQNTGSWVEQFSGRRIKPGQSAAPGQLPVKPRIQQHTPLLPTPHTLPFRMNRDRDTELPPYADPNSI